MAAHGGAHELLGRTSSRQGTARAGERGAPSASPSASPLSLAPSPSPGSARRGGHEMNHRRAPAAAQALVDSHPRHPGAKGPALSSATASGTEWGGAARAGCIDGGGRGGCVLRRHTSHASGWTTCVGANQERMATLDAAWGSRTNTDRRGHAKNKRARGCRGAGPGVSSCAGGSGRSTSLSRACAP